jgi:hypothetical protein
MSTFQELVRNPPVLNKVVDGAKEIVIQLISSMCDNRDIWVITMNKEGKFKIDTNGYSFNNFQIRYSKTEVERECDNNNWLKVFTMINSGESRIKQIRSSTISF